MEDVTAFKALIKEDFGVRHEEELSTAFNKLSDKVHPLAMGNVCKLDDCRINFAS